MNNKNDYILEFVEGMGPKIIDYYGALNYSLFKDPMASPYRVYFDQNHQLKYIHGIYAFNPYKKETSNVKVNTRQLLINLYEDIEKNKDSKIKIFALGSYEYIVYGYLESNHGYSFTLDLTSEGDSADCYIEVFTSDIESFMKEMERFFITSTHKDKIEFGIAAIDATNTIYNTYYEYKPFEIDIDKNYNDDIKDAYDRLCTMIESEDTSGLALLYGDPGTGKSSLLKHLISKYPQIDFVFLDGTLLANASQQKMMTYFLENQNTVFILEDCEKVLMSRDKSYNPVMPILLNLTDGIISDILGIKIICTFNTALSNIDKALLRKGRLTMKYEFRPLSASKASKILGHEVQRPMPLSDIYNEDEENDFSKNNTARIGFTR